MEQQRIRKPPLSPKQKFEGLEMMQTPSIQKRPPTPIQVYVDWRVKNEAYLAPQERLWLGFWLGQWHGEGIAKSAFSLLSGKLENMDCALLIKALPFLWYAKSWGHLSKTVNSMIMGILNNSGIRAVTAAATAALMLLWVPSELKSSSEIPISVETAVGFPGDGSVDQLNAANILASFIYLIPAVHFGRLIYQKGIDATPELVGALFTQYLLSEGLYLPWLQSMPEAHQATVFSVMGKGISMVGTPRYIEIWHRLREANLSAVCSLGLFAKIAEKKAAQISSYCTTTFWNTVSMVKTVQAIKMPGVH
jgi:hypothetical protein